MRAAVVTSFDKPPAYREFPTPEPHSPDEVLVEVIASGLHPRVRSQANGSHYTSSDELPLVPGIDGVGRAADGTLLYFVLPDTTMGAMAERTVVDLRRSIVLPAGSDAILLAAGMNPAMSAWLSLRRRIEFQWGQKVLVLGATGNAGRLAIQVAKHLGASHVVGAGRNPQRLATLPRLGADATVSLNDTPDAVGRNLAQAAADVDIVLDYLWGETAAQTMIAIVTNRTDQGQPLTWIEVGAITGPTASIPAAALRASRLEIVGSGQGSVSNRDILEELPHLAMEITKGTFEVDARTVPLAEFESAWNDVGSEQRIVITP